jgi:integrase
LFRIDCPGKVSVDAFQRAMSTLHKRHDVSLKTTGLKRRRKRWSPSAALVECLIRTAHDEVPDPNMIESDLRRAELRRLRNVALIETLRCTGARISEVLILNRQDLHAESQSAVLRKENTKGEKKDRQLLFTPGAWRALKEYLDEAGDVEITGPLFRSHSRKGGSPPAHLEPCGAQYEIRRLRQIVIDDLRREMVSLLLPKSSPESVEVLVNAFDSATEQTGGLPSELFTALQQRPDLRDQVQYLKGLAGEAQRVTAHCFRHGVITRIIQKTGDLVAAQRIAGHADVRTTSDYAHLDDKHLRDIHQKALG